MFRYEFIQIPSLENGDNKEHEDMMMTNSITKKLELYARKTGQKLQNLKEYRFMTKGKTSCFSLSVSLSLANLAYLAFLPKNNFTTAKKNLS